MKCSKAMMKYTGYLHIIALVVAIYGTMHQIDAVKNDKPYSVALSLSLTVIPPLFSINTQKATICRKFMLSPPNNILHNLIRGAIFCLYL